MKLLNTKEITQVAGGDFYIGDGLNIHVSSAGISSNAYNYIDTVYAMIFSGQMSVTDGAMSIYYAGYSDAHDIYTYHIDQGNYYTYYA